MLIFIGPNGFVSTVEISKTMILIGQPETRLYPGDEIVGSFMTNINSNCMRTALLRLQITAAPFFPSQIKPGWTIGFGSRLQNATCTAGKLGPILHSSRNKCLCGNYFRTLFATTSRSTSVSNG